MIIYLKNHEIDREQWDNCIKNSSCATPYPYSWFLDIISPGWEALVDDDYDSVFPIPVRKRFNISYISTPLFLQQLGAYSPDKPASSVIYEFLQYMPDFYRYIDLNIGQNIEYDGIKVTEQFNYVLDLSKPYEKLRENFTPECRRKVDSAEKKGIELVSDIMPYEIIDLFLQNNGKDKTITQGDYRKLKNLMEFCLKNKKGKISGVRSGRKKLVYGIFIVEVYGRQTILFDANTNHSREKRIGYFVINELLKHGACNRTLLDFAGSLLTESVPFAESFGASEVPYYRIHRNRLLWPGWMLR